MSEVPPGVQDRSTIVASHGGHAEWFPFKGEMRWDNVIVVDEVNNKVLLGFKKEGFGAGNYNPFAGEIKDGITGEQAARRDLKEQTGLDAEKIFLHGRICVVLEGMEQCLDVEMYKVTEWKGDVTETQTMRGEWFSPESIPYGQMFDDDKYWLPLFLGSKKFAGRVDFGAAPEGKFVGELRRWWFGTLE